MSGKVDKVVYLMRGLPGCGKSFTARKLAGETGVVLETDTYFYTQVGDDPGKYDWSDDLLPVARQWNLARFREAVSRGVSPVVVDRGNGLNPETREYAVFGVEHGYRGRTRRARVALVERATRLAEVQEVRGRQVIRRLGEAACRLHA